MDHYSAIMMRQAAIVTAAAARAQIKAVAMTAENQQRILRGESLAYDEDAICAVIDEEGIGFNSVIMTLNEGQR